MEERKYTIIKYEKGEPFNRVKSINVECTMVEMTPHGLEIIVIYDKPTEEEKAQFNYNKYFEIREKVVYDKIIYLTMKIGDLPWFDAPYTPHLTLDMPNFDDFKDGLPVTMLLLDLETKVIEADIRRMYLGKAFTEIFINDIKMLQNQSFSKDEYDQLLYLATNRYSTMDLAVTSDNICKVNK